MYLRPLVILFLVILTLLAKAQCLTDFTKLLPEPSTNYTQDFGKATAMFDDVLAIGAPNSDTLGRLTGIVNLFKKNPTGWKKIGVLKPSTPQDALQFGSCIEMTQNYIIVGSIGYGGKVFVFKKPPTGCQTSTETAIITAANTHSFGSGIRFNSSIALSDDEQTLAITDQNYTSGNKYGAFFVYHKTPAQEWSNSVAPKIILAPEEDVLDFGTGGIDIQGNRIACASPYANGGLGAIYIFSDPSGTFSNPQFEAKLSPGIINQSFFMGYNNFVFTPEGIFASGYVTTNAALAYRIIFFQQPGGTWSNSFPTCTINSVTNASQLKQIPIRLAYDGTNLFCSYQETTGNGKLAIVKKTTDWCSATTEVIETITPFSPTSPNYFGNSLACDRNGNVIVGLIPLPDNPSAQLALKIFSPGSNGTWTSNTIYNPQKSTAGHYYGSKVLGFDNFMFVGAPGDGTAKSNAGAVYSYVKSGNSWAKTGKIIAPVVSSYDDVFGTGLACNGDYLAIGASGFEPTGQTLIYKKQNADWSNPQLVQKIIIPDSIYASASGANMAITKDWLVLSIARHPPSGELRNAICIYKFNGTTWDFNQRVELGFGNIFSKEATVAVDIEGETILAGNKIIEQNSSNKWEVKYVLYQTDPEPIQISSDFTHWVTNGDMFGASVDLTENAAFIGAPTKDYNGIWDVGAVYVYTRKPGYTWSSGTETTKLLPRVRDERELFGYSIKSLYNTLIAGAPGADFNRDGVTARNKPGRAYIIQSKDFFWKNTINLVDFTGDSNVKDYFGVEVNLDESDFFISSTIEDNLPDKLAGAVYVTPTPPLIKLIPPVCLNQGLVDLFGYPFVGTWSGPGIIDSEKGIFDPQTTGTGTFEFTYKTESCFYEGKLLVEVKTPPPAEVKPDLDLVLCKKGKTSLKLSVLPQSNCSYRWFYREDANHSFSEISDSNNYEIIISKEGQYQAEINNGFCRNSSSIIIVELGVNQIDIKPIPEICDPQIITLSASPPNGTWSSSTGLFITGNSANVQNLPRGIYKVTYTITSQNQCIFSKEAEIKINSIPKPAYKKTGNVCDPAGVTLSVDQPVSDFSYSWKKMNDKNGYETISSFQSSPVLTVNTNGTYQLDIKNSSCAMSLPAVVINDKFSIVTTPTEKQVETCLLKPFVISTNGLKSDAYQWYYSSLSTAQMDDLTDDGSSIEVKETGYYKVKVKRGSCFFESQPQFVQIHPGDTLYIPNVFTPNGDGKNEKFKASTNVKMIDMKVISRSGNEMYQGDGKKGWDGRDASPGVYYWQATYKDCLGHFQELKGYVHLIH